VGGVVKPILAEMPLLPCLLLPDGSCHGSCQCDLQKELRESARKVAGDLWSFLEDSIPGQLFCCWIQLSPPEQKPLAANASFSRRNTFTCFARRLI